MAYKNSLTQWVLNNKHVLNPSFTEFDWPRRYYRGVYDFETCLNIDGITYIGRGIDINREVALEKATSEAIERLVCVRLQISSVGVAMSGAVSSSHHARLECLERYYFNRQFETKKYFYKFNEDNISAKFKLQNLDSDVQFLRYSTAIGLFGVACLIISNQVPISLGLAISENELQATQRSFFESISNFARYKDTISDFEKERASGKYWHLEANTLDQVMKITKSTVSDYRPDDFEPLVSEEVLDTVKIQELKDCPIDPVRCLIVSQAHL